ncbi:MAG: hypothetical protein ACFFBP_06250 [Promethearchaeota archaeon]
MERKEKSKKYKNKVLNCLQGELFGLTIIDLAKKINGNRNTVSKYLGILEAEGKVFKENIGTASVYYAKERKSLSFELVIAFYKSLVGALKRDLPNKEDFIKNLGKRIADYPFIQNVLQIGEKIKDQENIQKMNLIKFFTKEYRKYFDNIFYRIDPLDISIMAEKNRIIYHMKNSKLLEDNGEYIYHYYLLSGFFEARISEIFNMDIKCNVVDYKTSKNDESNYIVIEFEFPLQKIEKFQYE